MAHSITLALATTGLLLIPGRIVEPLIAASIVYVGIENLVRGVQGSRWKLTFGFGLVHGLGFATVLRDLGIGTNGNGAIALPLASFNAGVEIGQMAVAVRSSCRCSGGLARGRLHVFDLLPRGP